MKSENGELVRSVGFWGLAAMVFNGMVGAGIFSLPGTVSQNVGPFAPLIVLGVGLAFLPIVLGMILLARMFDRTGGPVAYVGEAFGPVAGFQVGWLGSLSSGAALAANANLLADYVLSAAPKAVGGPAAHGALVLVTMATVLIVNLFSARRSAGVLGVLSLTKTAPLLWLLVLATPMILHPSAASAMVSQTWDPLKAAVLAAYAFIGFEGALTPAGEARNPERDLPRATFFVFLAVVGLYALVTWGFVAVAYDPHLPAKAPLTQMGEALAGHAGLLFMLLGATLSILGNIISVGLVGSRRLVALEEQGTAPRWFGWINPRNGVPRNAVIFFISALTVLAMTGGFKVLAVLSVATRLLVYLASLAALPVIRSKRGLPAFRSVDLLVLPAVPICLLLLARTELDAWIRMAIAMAVGIAILLAAQRARAASMAEAGAL